MKYLICPVCKSRFYIDVLKSNPPQYEGACKNVHINGCDFIVRFYDRENPHEGITQEELQKIYEDTH